MPFQPQLGTPLRIAGKEYRFAAHPTARGMPHGLEGREATVYEVTSPPDRWALKVFKPRYRLPDLVSLSTRLKVLAVNPGLLVCDRIVITPAEHAVVIAEHPDLLYAVLMPWIKGPTWWDVVVTKRAMDRATSFRLAHALASVLAMLESLGQSHSDLSGPNLLLPGLVGDALDPVQLVDVEQMYVPGFTEPEGVAAGSPGYAHPSGADAKWGPAKDRFAGAVLIAEMLGWSDHLVRQAASQETFFEQADIQSRGPRYGVLEESLDRSWGPNVARCLSGAWHSSSVDDCPRFSNWLEAIEGAEERGAVEGAAARHTNRAVHALLAAAERFDSRSESAAALEVLSQAQRMAVPDSADWQLVMSRATAIRERHSSAPNRSGPATGNGSFAARSDDLIPWSQAISPTKSRASATYIGVFAAAAILLGFLAFILAPTLNTLGPRTTNQLVGVGGWVFGSFALATLIGVGQAVGFRARLAPSRRVAFVVISAAGGALGGIVAGWLWSSGLVPDQRSGALLGAVMGLVASVGQNRLLGGHGGGAKWVIWSTVSGAGIWFLATSLTWTANFASAIGISAVVIIVLTGVANVGFLQVAQDVEF